MQKVVDKTVKATGELLSKQFTHMNGRLRLTNPTSDETLSDRAFHGTGSRVSQKNKSFSCGSVISLLRGEGGCSHFPIMSY